MSNSQKNPCPDCAMCQWCSDDRCRLCLKPGAQKKLCIAEQIERYESLNGHKNKVEFSGEVDHKIRPQP